MQEPTYNRSDEMPFPFIAAALPALIDAIPSLIRIFGDSPQAEKNAKAAEKVAAVVQEATGTKNIQEAVEEIQKDPQQLEKATQAVEKEWFTLTEMGGGVAEARKAAVEMAVIKPARNYVLWMSLAIIPLVYMVTAAVTFNLGSDWPSDTRTMVVSLVVGGALGSVTGFWLGSSQGSHTKEKALQDRIDSGS